MSLPRITVQAAPGEPPVVTVAGSPVPGVASAQVTVTADGVPRVALVLTAASIDLELPAGVTVLRAGPTAAEFADQLDARRLERDALAGLDDADTHGAAYATAVRAQAAEFDDHRG